MRIALSYPDVNRRGGIERVITECVQYLAGKGHDLLLVASRVDPGTVPDGVRPELVKSPRAPATLSMIRFRRGAERALERAAGEFDIHAAFGSQSPGGGVLWVPSVHKAALEALLARRGRLGRLPLVLNPDHRVRLRLEERHYRPRDYLRLIANGSTVKDDLVRHHGVPEEDIDVLPPGFQESAFNVARRTELRPEARARLGLSESDRVLVFVANELERKGFGPLIEALARLGERDVRLLVVGRVRSRPYQERIERLGLAGRVSFVGPSDDVSYFLAAADVFVLPTLYEPWGLVIVEALASGLPVVTTSLAGAAEAVEPGRTGVLIDDPDDTAAIAEAIASLLRGGADPPGVISESVAHLSWTRVLERYERILEGMYLARAT